jgi:broad specificity phosphatase PhoE
MRPKQLRRIQNFYRTCWPARLLRPEDGLGQPWQIVTIRHARPDLERAKRYSAAAARQYFKDYDAAPILPVSEPSFVLGPGEVDRVHASPLVRSVATARALFGPEQELRSDPQFRELERAVPGGWFDRRNWPLWAWQLLTRGSYLLGCRLPGIEPFRAARQRIAGAATVLEDAARREGAAVLVGHGFFNYFLGRQLRWRGWHRVRRPGRDYLGVAVFVRDRR